MSSDQPIKSSPARPGPASDRPGIFRFSVRRFLISLGLLLVVTPFVEDLKHGQTIESALATLVLFTGVFAVGGRRRTRIVAIILVIPAVTGNLTNHFWPDHYPLALVFVTRLVFLAFLVTHLMGFILRSRKVNSEVLCGAVSVYLLLGVIWGIAYRLVAHLSPEAFNFSVPTGASHTMNPFNAIYFSYITLTTVGYGDITPVSNIARMLALTEALTGTLFMAVLVARLVSLYSTPDASGTAGDLEEKL